MSITKIEKERNPTSDFSKKDNVIHLKIFEFEHLYVQDIYVLSKN